eukprot:GHVO01069976.1.p1 GENE.GHVO01069976.1~~GHVO01069976.1.p1  ORF type:complete len:813 (-),score=162.24 GHVO01069976.1:342-2486(-)
MPLTPHIRAPIFSQYYTYAGWAAFQSLQFALAFKLFISADQIHILQILDFWKHLLPDKLEWISVFSGGAHETTNTDKWFPSNFNSIIPLTSDVQDFISSRLEAMGGNGKPEGMSKDDAYMAANKAFLDYLRKESKYIRCIIQHNTAQCQDVHTHTDRYIGIRETALPMQQDGNRIHICEELQSLSSLLSIIESLCIILDCMIPLTEHNIWTCTCTKKKYFEVSIRPSEERGAPLHVPNPNIPYDQIKEFCGQRLDILAIVLRSQGKYEEVLSISERILTDPKYEHGVSSCHMFMASTVLEYVYHTVSQKQENEATALLMKWIPVFLRNGMDDLAAQLVGSTCPVVLDARASYESLTNPYLLSSECTAKLFLSSQAGDDKKKRLQWLSQSLECMVKNSRGGRDIRQQLVLVYIQMVADECPTPPAPPHSLLMNAPVSDTRGRLLSCLDVWYDLDVDELLTKVENTGMIQETIILLLRKAEFKRAFDTIRVYHDIDTAIAIAIFLKYNLASTSSVKCPKYELPFSHLSCSSISHIYTSTSFWRSPKCRHLDLDGLVAENREGFVLKDSANRDMGDMRSKPILSLFKSLLGVGIDETDSVELSDIASEELPGFRPSDIDLYELITIISDAWPISRFSSYLLNTLRFYAHNSLMLSLKQHLCRAAYLDVYCKWAELTSQSVQLTSEQICSRCTRRIGKHPFAVTSHDGGTFVHLQCLE